MIQLSNPGQTIKHRLNGFSITTDQGQTHRYGSLLAHREYMQTGQQSILPEALEDTGVSLFLEAPVRRV
jgi:hypothetical protein